MGAAMFGKTQWKRSGKTGSRQHHNSRSRRLSFEQFEQRRVLTSTIFLDFGEGFNFGGLQTTVGDYRNIFGVGSAGLGTGPDFSPPYADAAPLVFNTNPSAVAVKNDVLQRIQSVLAPFDINVVLASANSLNDAWNTVNANQALAKRSDAYVFIADVTTTNNVNVGASLNLAGLAAQSDIGGLNDEDESVLVFANQLAGTNLAHRIALVATHEAFHTFGLMHTDGQAAKGDVIIRGTDFDPLTPDYGNIDDPFMVTRFELEKDILPQGPPPIDWTDNPYLTVRNDPQLGLKDSDSDGIPNMAYVTGTGAYDVITLSYVNSNEIHVTIYPYTDASYTTPVSGGEGYYIAINNDQDGGGIVIDAGVGDDKIVLDINGSLANSIPIFVRGSIGNDSLVVGSFQSAVNVYFDGGTGTDQVNLIGTSANDAFENPYGVLYMVGKDARIYQTNQFESLVVEGLDGNDVLYFRDFGFSQNVRFYGGNGYDELSAIGTAGIDQFENYTDSTNSFGRVGNPARLLQTGDFEDLRFHGLGGNDVVYYRSFAFNQSVRFFGGDGYDEFSAIGTDGVDQFFDQVDQAGTTWFERTYSPAKVLQTGDFEDLRFYGKGGNDLLSISIFAYNQFIRFIGDGGVDELNLNGTQGNDSFENPFDASGNWFEKVGSAAKIAQTNDFETLRFNTYGGNDNVYLRKFTSYLNVYFNADDGFDSLILAGDDNSSADLFLDYGPYLRHQVSAGVFDPMYVYIGGVDGKYFYYANVQNA
jgi:hypothetical protein